ncbi:unnamed protein product [Nezara viridula]|uniref:Uncharacterized protein n=1 Tax=Nezara viridula TaxID=85310 RepID=A0A9P0H1Y4_NEZVI|nr:unnamed protein product [Nezara viridula]
MIAMQEKLILFFGKPVTKLFLYIFVRTEELLSKCLSSINTQ